MHAGHPQLAVLIPVYNDQIGLEKTLRSLQTACWPVPSFIVTVDDGSFPKIAIRPEQWPGIQLVNIRVDTNRGVESALNTGLSAALERGAVYVARLDAGDTVHPLRFARQIELLESDRRIGIVASDVRFEDEEGNKLFDFVGPRTDAEIRRRMHLGLCLIDPSVTFRADLFRNLGGYSKEFPAAEGYEVAYRFLAHANAACVPEVLTITPLVNGGLSVSRRREQLKSKLRLQLRHFDFSSPYSFFGVATTALLFLIPRTGVLALKRFIGKSWA